MRVIYTIFIFLSFWACKNEKSTGENRQNTRNKSISSIGISEEEGLTGDTSAIIAKIRTQYQAIKADSAKDTHQKLETECDGMFGTATFQSQNGKIRQISYLYGSDHSGITEEYYFQNDALFFVFIEDAGWMFDPEDPEKTIDEAIQTRYYIDNNQIIRAIRKQAKGRASELDKLLNSAKNEILKGEKLEEWQKKAQALKDAAKSKNLEVYLCK